LRQRKRNISFGVTSPAKPRPLVRTRRGRAIGGAGAFRRQTKNLCWPPVDMTIHFPHRATCPSLAEAVPRTHTQDNFLWAGPEAAAVNWSPAASRLAASSACARAPSLAASCLLWHALRNASAAATTPSHCMVPWRPISVSRSPVPLQSDALDCFATCQAFI